MFEVIGHSEKSDYCYCEDECDMSHTHVTEDIVATFDREQDAMDYIKNSYLKNRKAFCSNPYETFKQNTLLHPYNEAFIRPNSLHGVPHNPGLGEIDRWDLIGLIDDNDSTGRIVATFDTVDKAEEYVEWSKLARYSPYNDINFRKKSLLRNFRSSRIQSHHKQVVAASEVYIQNPAPK